MTPPREVRAAVWDASNGRCHYCECALHPFRNFQVDHVVPRRQGGSDDLTNLVGACVTCNARKGPRLTFDPSAPPPACAMPDREDRGGFGCGNAYAPTGFAVVSVARDLLLGAGVFATPREASLSVTRPIHDGYLTVHRFPDYGQGRRRFVAIAAVGAFIAAA